MRCRGVVDVMMSKTKAALIEKLYKVQCSRDFVLGVISPLESDEEYQIIIDCIESGVNDPSKLILAALSIDKDRVRKSYDLSKTKG